MVRTVENLLYLLRRWVVCLRGDFFIGEGSKRGVVSIHLTGNQKECDHRFRMSTRLSKRF